jgi:drug/metabolite transporter (DMT)-like permease
MRHKRIDLPQALLASGTAARAAFDNPVLRGVALMFVSTFFFAAMHGSIRYVSATVHPFEIALFRNVFAMVVVLPWFWRYGIAPLRTRRFGLHALRALFNIMAMLSFFYALSVTPLSEVTALGFTAPIFATVLAALLLREVVRARRWCAIAIGFLGTLIILRPGFEAIGFGQMLVLFSSMIWACALLVIKTLGRTDSSVTIISYMALLMIPLSLVPALFVWRWPEPLEWCWLIGIGMLGGIAQFCMTEALRQADTAVVMPIDFFKLVWVTLIAWLAFAEHLDLYTWIGGAVIFASTLYIAYRERAGQTQT